MFFKLHPPALRRAFALAASALAVAATAAASIAPAAADERGRLHAPSGVQRSWVDPRYAHTQATGAPPAVVYVSQAGYGTVLAYPTATSSAPGSPIETISGLNSPEGLAVDAGGDLYVVEAEPTTSKCSRPARSYRSKR